MNGTRPLHVLMIHNRYRSVLPSGEDRVVDQERSLLAENGHRVTMFERRSDDIATMPITDKVRVPLRVPWNGAARRELVELLRAALPDVVHVHNTFPLLSPSVLAACRDVGVPVVASLHNYYLVCPVGTLLRDGRPCTDCVGRLPIPSLVHGCYRGSRLATLPMTVNMLANRQRWWSLVDRFFCVSDSQRKILVNAGVPADKLSVKHHFVADPGLRRVGSGRYVLYLGRMTEEKGIRSLIEAWDALDARDALGIPLVLAGDGPLGVEVREWASRRSDVRYVGLQTREQCRDLTADAAVVVSPSLANETFGLVIAEAMACGVPAVVAARGAYTELVQDGETGMLHRPGDAASLAGALRHVMTDIERNARMGAAARRRYESFFSPAVGIAALLAGYEAAMSGAIRGIHHEKRGAA